MGDENSEMMNLDLNLGPSSPPDTDSRSESLMSENVNLEDWIEGQRVSLPRQNVRSRMRQRWRSLLGPLPTPFEPHNITTGEGSASLDDDVAKECETDAILVEDEKIGKKEEGEKGSSVDEGSFFDCNICLDVSSDPVLTCCGHLFCWPCLHQWLNVHSDTKECPVCKGEVTEKNLTPIYGRGGDTHESKNEKTSLNIPDRPQAKRVESWRQIIQRNAYALPMDEMIRRLGSVESLNESGERNGSFFNRVLTSRGMRQEEVTTTVTPDDVIEIDLTRSSRVRSDADARRVESYLRRSHTYRSAPTVELANITQRLIESYLRYTSVERSEDQPIPVDDRDSVSSIAAVIHSESQVEIDSNVSLSTSSSRRRIDHSRVSDVDSEDSRAPRRRRLN